MFDLLLHDKMAAVKKDLQGPDTSPKGCGDSYRHDTCVAVLFIYLSSSTACLSIVDTVKELGSMAFCSGDLA